MSNIYQGTLGLIGNTPLVELTHVELSLIHIYVWVLRNGNL